MIACECSTPYYYKIGSFASFVNMDTKIILIQFEYVPSKEILYICSVTNQLTKKEYICVCGEGIYAIKHKLLYVLTLLKYHIHKYRVYKIECRTQSFSVLLLGTSCIHGFMYYHI